MALDVNADAIAYSTLLFSMNTSAINSKRGKGNFKYPAYKFFETE
jgi:aminopeptidase Y